MKACEAIVPATSRPPKSDHSFLRHIVPFCQKRDELTWERVAGWTNRHRTAGGQGTPTTLAANPSKVSKEYGPILLAAYIGLSAIWVRNIGPIYSHSLYRRSFHLLKRPGMSFSYISSHFLRNVSKYADLFRLTPN